MASINKVILVGNVGKDPEVRTFPNGGKVANFSIATSESWKDKASGEKKERTEWHRISVTNEHLIAVVENYVKKGSRIYIEGQLETRKWKDKDGNEKFSTEVTVRPYRGEIVLLSSKDKPADGDVEHVHAEPVKTGGGGATNSDMNDEIPFVTQFGSI